MICNSQHVVSQVDQHHGREISFRLTHTSYNQPKPRLIISLDMYIDIDRLENMRVMTT